MTDQNPQLTSHSTEPTAREARLYRRILRRETHSSRATAATIVAALIALVLAYLAVEAVLRALGLAPLLASPAQLADGVISAPTSTALAAGGIVAAVIGVIVLIVGITGGRRARHEEAPRRAAVVVDNEVIASALARHAARVGRTTPDNTRVSVGHRQAVVELTPTTGTPVEPSAVKTVVEEQLAGFELIPGIRSRVVVAAHGKVGA